MGKFPLAIKKVCTRSSAHVSEVKNIVPKIVGKSTYSKYVHEDFPLTSENGVMVKTILGEHSPINLVIDAKLYDVEIGNGATYKFALSPNRTLAGLSIRGNGGVIDGLEFHLRTRISL
ncbi:hypothetical protein QFZ31_001003 [Neobacillus niacini]|uniref:hypothetical protein n=1 Tax=Neobacillus driksii TaxID=3035913 RepID=UPI002786BEFD|nr:hypothetical protein [Neobacillus niacini]MDQ0971125.1 hypothetical protein [Neobacillus niacini]